MNEIKSSDANMSGEAGVIRKIAIASQPVVIEAVIQITRKETGAVEEYRITGTLPAQEKEA
jgi:hypothetical protein